MRGRVIAHGRFANCGIDYGVYFLAYANWLLGNHLVRADTLDRVVASGNFGDYCIVIVGVEPSAIAYLASGFGIEGRVVEDDLAVVSGLEFLRALTGFDDG